MSGAEILYQGITEIDDDLVEMAQSYGLQSFGKDYGMHRQNMQKQRFWIRWGGYSACAAIIAAVLLILPMSKVMVEDPGLIMEENNTNENNTKESIAEGSITGFNGLDVKPGTGDLAAKKDPDGNTQMAAQTEQGQDILILNHVDMGMTEIKIDGQSQPLDGTWSPEAREKMEQEFASMLGISYADFQANIFPGEADAWVKKKAYALYTHSAKSDNPEEYQLYQYAFIYQRAEGEGMARIALSAPWSPLADYYLDLSVLQVPPEHSVINGVQLYIYEWRDRWFTSFEWQGVYYEVETTDLTEQEMVKLLKGLMASGAHHTSDVDPVEISGLADGEDSAQQATQRTAWQTEDGPVDESTYHEARTYSEEIMDLQERISRAMVDRELPFVISSAIRENPDRIVVTVTTQDESLLAELRAYDATGKLMEIQFAGEKGAALKEDLAVLE
ncbi:MAG: hypothetical protein J6M66_06835 [Lachnospiraceae bacterium]|nr:hypothetical protein [Lachnospiraceae bacterium]